MYVTRITPLWLVEPPTERVCGAKAGLVGSVAVLVCLALPWCGRTAGERAAAAGAVPGSAAAAWKCSL